MMAEPRTQLVLAGLLQRAATLKDEPGWEPLRPGVHIRRLYEVPDGGPAAALLRYQPGASIAAHETSTSAIRLMARATRPATWLRSASVSASLTTSLISAEEST